MSIRIFNIKGFAMKTLLAPIFIMATSSFSFCQDLHIPPENINSEIRLPEGVAFVNTIEARRTELYILSGYVAWTSPFIKELLIFKSIGNRQRTLTGSLIYLQNFRTDGCRIFTNSQNQVLTDCSYIPQTASGFIISKIEEKYYRTSKSLVKQFFNIK
jgi:hypothetical protein